MNRLASAKRYAKALFDLAREQNALGEIHEQFRSFVEIIAQNEELQKFLRTPQVKTEDKKAVLAKLTQNSHPYLQNFVQYMTDKGHENVFPQTFARFEELVNQHEGIAEAVIYSALPLSDQEIAKIAERFSAKLGKQVRARNEVDGTLIGGIVVRIGDRLYDGSIKGQLERFHKKVLAQTV